MNKRIEKSRSGFYDVCGCVCAEPGGGGEGQAFSQTNDSESCFAGSIFDAEITNRTRPSLAATRGNNEWGREG